MRPAFSPDGKTVYFTHADGDKRTIMVSHRRHGVWSKPKAAAFPVQWRDIEPAMALDGSYLLFVSNRPSTDGGKVLDGFWGGQVHPGKGGNLWRVDRVEPIGASRLRPLRSSTAIRLFFLQQWREMHASTVSRNLTKKLRRPDCIDLNSPPINKRCF